MAWVTTNTDVATTLTVEKKVEGQALAGYPKPYSLLSAFGSKQAITANEWQKMSLTPRNERIDEFKAYVENAENISIAATQTNDVFRPSSETPGVIVEQ